VGQEWQRRYRASRQRNRESEGVIYQLAMQAGEVPMCPVRREVSWDRNLVLTQLGESGHISMAFFSVHLTRSVIITSSRCIIQNK
jgi:hypothetical protein